MPTKATLANHTTDCIMTSYGISKELIKAALDYFTKHKLQDFPMGLAFDSIYIEVNDSIHASTQTRHGFTAVHVTADKTYHFSPSFQHCNSLDELLAPLVRKEPYANQILMFTVFPLTEFDKSPMPILPIGFIPLTSYNDELLDNWLTEAMTELQAVGLNVIFQSGDNCSAHQSYFNKQLTSHPVFPIRDWNYGLSSMSPVPLQDYPHLLRKLISPLLKPSHNLLVGNLPILQTLFLRAQTELQFPISYLVQHDEQNDQRVAFFCSKEFLAWVQRQQEGKGLHMYLTHVHLLREAFVHKTMSWACRLYSIYQALCFFVYWHSSAKGRGNFITSQTFTAVVQICLSFILLVQLNKASLKKIAPWHLYEKPCESLFSTIRSWIRDCRNVTATECFDIVNKYVQFKVSDDKPISHKELSLEIELANDDSIRYVLSKADLVVRELLQPTSLCSVLDKYPCVAFAYQDQLEDVINLIDAPNRAVDFLPPALPTEMVCGGRQQVRNKYKAYIHVPETVIQRLQGIGIKIYENRFASKESLISVLSHRRSTSSYSSKNRIERANNNCLKPEKSTLLEELSELIPDLVSDESEESEVDSTSIESNNNQSRIEINKWFWANQCGDEDEEDLSLIAQISQPMYYKRRDKQKVDHDIRTTIFQDESASFLGKCMIIPTTMDGENLICSTSSVKWADVELKKIITSVVKSPRINPWEWSKGELRAVYSVVDLTDSTPALSQFLVETL